MPRRPNVLWIFCDELRTDAVACYGNDYADIATPAIDSIGVDGARFERFYVNSPVCVPSRTASLTGLLPTRTGVYHNEGLFLPAPQGARSFVELLRDAGYVAVNLGKEHVPRGLRGFDRSDATGAGQLELMVEVGRHRDQLGLVTEAIGLHAATWPAGVPYPPDQLTDRALGWLHTDRPAERPWLLRVSYLQPHTPVVVPEPWASRYDAEAWPDEFGPDGGLSDYERTFAASANSRDLTPEQIAAGHSRYHGVVSWIDDQVHQLLGALDDLGLREDTIVVFASDHGAQLGELGGAYGKMTFSHCSHRVPFIVSWPGQVPTGDRRPDLAQSVDLGPTLLDLVGLDVPDGLDGRRLFTDPAPDSVAGAIGYGNPSSRALAMLDRGDFHGLGWPQRFCVRTDRWRYDRSTRRDGAPLDGGDHDAFLADLRHDPREEHNAIADPANAHVVERMEDLLSLHVDGALQVEPDAYAGWRSIRDQRLMEELQSRF